MITSRSSCLCITLRQTPAERQAHACTHTSVTMPPSLQVYLTPNSEWGGEGSLGCGIGYGYLHRIPDTKQEKPVDPEIGVAGKGVESGAPPPSEAEGYTDVSVAADVLCFGFASPLIIKN